MDSGYIDQPGRTLVDLELCHIYKQFDENEVVSDLSLTVFKGELCCLLGSSGCGKSTTLKIITGLVKPSSGTIHLAGREITDLPIQRRNVGMVFQNYALFPHMDVYENVAYGLRRQKLSGDIIKIKVAEVLQLVELSEYSKRRIHELSGGQQQRVALARSLVIEPDLLLLDEPLSNLDARLRENMRNEIRRIQQALNITTVFVTHDQEEAMSISDRIGVMNNGIIEQIGTPREIYDQPQTQFVSDFIGRANFIPGLITKEGLFLLGRLFPINIVEYPIGTKVICSVRPERVIVDTLKDERIPAVIIDTTYNGSIVHYVVTVTPDGEPAEELIIEISSPYAVHNPGDLVGLEIDGENFQLFKQE